MFKNGQTVWKGMALVGTYLAFNSQTLKAVVYHPESGYREFKVDDISCSPSRT